MKPGYVTTIIKNLSRQSRYLGVRQALTEHLKGIESNLFCYAFHNGLTVGETVDTLLNVAAAYVTVRDEQMVSGCTMTEEQIAQKIRQNTPGLCFDNRHDIFRWLTAVAERYHLDIFTESTRAAAMEHLGMKVSGVAYSLKDGSVRCEADVDRFLPYIHHRYGDILKAIPISASWVVPSSDYLSEKELAIGSAGIYGVCVLGHIKGLCNRTEPYDATVAYGAYMDMAAVARREEKGLLTANQAEEARAQIRNALIVALALAVQASLVLIRKNPEKYPFVTDAFWRRYRIRQNKPEKLTESLFRFSVYRSYAAIQCWLRQLALAMKYCWKRPGDARHPRRSARAKHSTVPSRQPAAYGRRLYRDKEEMEWTVRNYTVSAMRWRSKVPVWG